MTMSQNEEYLGDGCYVSFDGSQLKLRAPREPGDDAVYLDPETYQALIEYAKRVGAAVPPRTYRRARA